MASKKLDLWKYLELESASQRVKRYFDNQEKFTGRAFETFAGGGDAPDVKDVFTSDDVVAVSLLSVNIPGSASLAILEQKRDTLSELLSGIPVELDLWDADMELIKNGGRADKLWQELEKISGVAWVTAGKLCARKRPRLIPVYDRIVKAALSPGRKSFWTDLHFTLSSDPKLIERLAEIRWRSSIDSSPSLLRVLDVAIWMESQD